MVLFIDGISFIQGQILFDKLQGLNYNQSVDWWSFGVLCYEMLIGQSPFSGCDEDELFWSICNEIPWYPQYLSKEALKILQSLLEKDVSIRLGSMGSPEGDIKYHPFFSDINWDKLERREVEPPFKPQVVSIIRFFSLLCHEYFTHESNRKLIFAHFSHILFSFWIFQRHPLDTKYFDSQFTRERARLTPIDKNILISMDQKQFEGFSYTNPNATLTWISPKNFEYSLCFFMYTFTFTKSICYQHQIRPPITTLIESLRSRKWSLDTSKFHLFENVFNVTNNHNSKSEKKKFFSSLIFPFVLSVSSMLT